MKSVTKPIALVLAALFLPLVWGYVQAPTTPYYDAPNAILFAGLSPIVADDATDNQPAILARLSALAATGKPGVIMLPAGRVRMASLLSLPPNIHLKGQGEATELLLAHGGYPSTNSGILLANASNVTVSDMTIRGTADSNVGGPYDLVQCTGSGNNITFRNVRFKWGRHAGLRTSGFTGKHLRVLDCHFSDILTPNMPGVTSGGGLQLSGGTLATVSRCTFSNVGNSGQAHALYATGLTDLTITDCVFDAGVNANTRLHLYSNISRVKVSNNTFIGGKHYWYASNSVYTGNLFVNGFAALSCNNSVIANNVGRRAAAGLGNALFELGGNISQVRLLGNTYQGDGTTNTYMIYTDVFGMSDCTIADNECRDAIFLRSLTTAINLGKDNTLRDNSCLYPGWGGGGATSLYSFETPYLTGSRLIDNYAKTTAARNGFSYSGGAAYFMDNRVGGGAVVHANIAPSTFLRSVGQP